MEKYTYIYNLVSGTIIWIFILIYFLWRKWTINDQSMGGNPLWFQGYTTNVLLLFVLDHLHDGTKSVKNMPMCFFSSVHLLPQIGFDFPLMIIIFTYINMAENISFQLNNLAVFSWFWLSLLQCHLHKSCEPGHCIFLDKIAKYFLKFYFFPHSVYSS